MGIFSDISEDRAVSGNKVATIITVHSERPSVYEIASLSQYARILGHYPTFLVCPMGMNTDRYTEIFPSLTVRPIEPDWFKSLETFARLKIEPFLYKSFRAYEYLFFYELDAWVFEDRLIEWCDKKFAYVGAPWFCDAESEKDLRCAFEGVGNGGFSLRSVESILRVSHSFSYIYTPQEIGEFLERSQRSVIRRALSMLKSFTVSNNSHHLLNNFGGHDDLYFGKYITRNFAWFTVPDMKQALLFSFEKRCEESYAYVNYQLPFGCHKWWNPDVKEFWKQFIPFPESDEA